MDLFMPWERHAERTSLCLPREVIRNETPLFWENYAAGCPLDPLEALLTL